VSCLVAANDIDLIRGRFDKVEPFLPYGLCMGSSSKQPLAFDEDTSWTPPWMRKPAEGDVRPVELREHVGEGEIRRFAGVSVPPPVPEAAPEISPAVPSLDPLVMPEIEAIPAVWLRLRIVARLALAVLLAVATAYMVVVRTSTSSTVAMGDSHVGPQPTPAIRDIRRPPTPRLTLMSPLGPLQNGQGVRLVGSVYGVGAGATLVFSGLSPDAKLAIGRPIDATSWLVDAADWRDAEIVPSTTFIGIMNLVVELRLMNGTIVDHQAARLEWLGRPLSAPPQNPLPRLDAKEVARLLKRGEELLLNGEVAASRLVFERLVDAGEPRAAIALAETYERGVLDKIGAQGLVADPAMARNWYEKAKELGSSEAQRRLEMLAGRTK